MQCINLNSYRIMIKLKHFYSVSVFEKKNDDGSIKPCDL